MADLLIRINAATEDFDKAIDGIKNRTAALESKLKSIGAASGVAFAAATGAAALAVNAFSKFEDALTEVGGATNISGAELKKVGVDIQNLSNRIPVATDELLKIAAAAGDLGITASADILKVTETVAKFGKVADVSGEEAAVALTKFLNITEGGVQNVDVFASVVVKLGDDFKTTESKILENSQAIAQATATYKLGSTEIAALATATSSLGVESGVAAKAMQMSFGAIDKAIRGGGAQMEALQQITGMTGAQLKTTFEKDATAVLSAFVTGLGNTKNAGGSVAAALEAVGVKGAAANKAFGALAGNADILTSALKTANDEQNRGTALNAEFAEASKKLSDKMLVLQNQIGNIGIQIGSNLAPYVEKATEFFSRFLEKMKDPAFAEFVANAILITGAVAGLVTGLSVLSLGFVSVVNALTILWPLLTGVGAAIAGITAPVWLAIAAFAALAAGVALIYANWGTIWPSMQAIFGAFVNNISALAGGIGTVLKGAFTLDPSGIQTGMAEINTAFAQGKSDFNSILAEKNAEMLALEQENRDAKREIAITNDQADLEGQIETDANKIVQTKLTDEELKVIANTKQQQDQMRRDQERVAAQQHQISMQESYIAFKQTLLATDVQFAAMAKAEQDKSAMARFQATQKEVLDEQSARDAAMMRRLEAERRNNRELMIARNDYRENALVHERAAQVAIAEVQSVAQRKEVKGFQQGTGEMTKLMGSKQRSLFEIGKAAAVAQIGVQTALSAMQVFAGFSTIPIVGPALGIAAAAAAIAFGVEQAVSVSQQQFQGAAEGGIMMGGIKGKDSIPSLLTPGELVAPARSFDEVVNAVAESRNRRTDLENNNAREAEGGTSAILIGFDGDMASQVLTAKQVEDRALGISRESVFS